MKTIAPPAVSTIVVVGKESVGKSQLIATLAGQYPSVENFRGSTVSVQKYASADQVFIDTPGILRSSDSETTQLALDELDEHDEVLLVIQATHLDDDLADMLPLVLGKRGVIAVTFWDKVQPGEASIEAIERLSRDAGVNIVAINARELSDEKRTQLRVAMTESRTFTKSALSVRAGWRIEPKPGVMDHRISGPTVAIALVLIPALATIYGANRLADRLHAPVNDAVTPVIRYVDAHFPEWARVVLTSTQSDFGYGLLNMGPFLIVWALPTVLLFSLILGFYKNTGLIERINGALHPLVRPLGLSGRDLVRVMMGFGCNVPAVISTRACSGCSRSSAISAVAFGSACSYQLPATLAVLAAAAATTGASAMLLSLAFLGYLLVTTLVYLRLTSPPTARNSLNLLMTPARPFLQRPTIGGFWRESWGTVKQFLLQAMPIFVAICVLASLMARLGILNACARFLAPLMSVFNLPADAALPVVLASIRKDGIFLFAVEEGLAVPMTTVQVLTAVYFAGVLLPCLVTALTIAKETSWKLASRILLRQASFAIVFTALLGWGGWWLGS